MNAHDQAYPLVEDNVISQTVSTGLSKKELFTAMAMQGLASAYRGPVVVEPASAATMAANSLLLADALIDALSAG